MPHRISAKLRKKRLDHLKTKMVRGMFAEQDRKNKLSKARKLVQNALFLRHDAERKKRWLSVLDEFDDQFLENFIHAIIRENFRYKKNRRDICEYLNEKFSDSLSSPA